MVDLSIKSTRAIRDWILAYQHRGIEALYPVTANHSYSKEFKIEMVRRYIAGEGSVTDLCARYGIPAHVTLQNWISLYNANIEYCIAHNRDYKGTASLYDVSYGQVYSWVRKYDAGGEDGLSDKRGRHKTDDEVDELERLHRDNLRLKRQLEEKDMVVELLKKVKEFEGM